ncbi:NAD(P)-binding protein [Pseudonocardia sp. RS010]|uniref:NAD(P)-binding protein n=1 Tax=Pseudonocardia sp. RS010 TaxID=3385979 RepID=UPI0039A1C5AE
MLYQLTGDRRRLAEDMGFAPVEVRRAPPDAPRAIVICAGVSGMLAAIRLAEAGIEHVVLEKNVDVGGTWLENSYPGAGVDTPSHLYSYSFAPRDWTTHFGKRDEVWEYLRAVADRHDLRERRSPQWAAPNEVYFSPVAEGPAT